jgi:Fur family ferric uptake transcriptional regulator
MSMKEIKYLLKPHGLKLTLPRLKLLEIFFSNDRALTQAELLRLTEQIFDRITVYRTLKSFEEIGIIHRIVGTNGSVNYAVSDKNNTNSETLHKQHLHFSCLKCNGVYCLDDHLVPSVTLPSVYEVHSINMTVTGICSKCIENQSFKTDL